MIHLDLFSGIGGFSIAVDSVWDNVEHIFCDNDKYCQKLIKLRYPESKIYGDIRTITDTKGWKSRKQTKRERRENTSRRDIEVKLLTGGFPCQPFSQAGKRGGTTDNRYLWPEMLRVIQLTKPTWIIAENVRGILTIEGGLVFEQVCLDLEGEGYKIQTFIIPAISQNAPHRRDRVWIVANRSSSDGRREGDERLQDKGWRKGKDRRESIQPKNRKACSDNIKQSNGNTPNSQSIGNRRSTSKECRIQKWKFFKKESEGSKIWSKDKGRIGDITNTTSKRYLQRKQENNRLIENKKSDRFAKKSWERNWIKVATELCRMDDGFPAKLDGFELSQAQHRVQRLKALGNAIVPQVAIEIMRAIKLADDDII